METRLHTVLADKAEILAGKGNALYSARPSMSAADAIRIMCDANVGCVLVMDNGDLVGILSERDVLRRIADRGLTPDQVTVGDVMTREIVTVKPGMTVEEALVQCTDRRIRHLPVWENGELLGLLSIGDLVRFVVKDKDRTIADLIDYIHGPQLQV